MGTPGTLRIGIPGNTSRTQTLTLGGAHSPGKSSRRLSRFSAFISLINICQTQQTDSAKLTRSWAGQPRNVSSAITSRRRQRTGKASQHANTSAAIPRDCCPLCRADLGRRNLGRPNLPGGTEATSDWTDNSTNEWHQTNWPTELWAENSVSEWYEEDWIDGDPTTWATHQMWARMAGWQIASLVVEASMRPILNQAHIMQTSKEVSPWPHS